MWVRELTGETIEKVLELSGLPADEAVDLLGTIALRIAERATEVWAIVDGVVRTR